VVLRPGARVPSDGVITAGRGIDEPTSPADPCPSRRAGAQVFEATVNLDGVLEVTVTKTVGDSTIAR
jgi:cation transport ATPase